ncbi:rhodanese-like domain-containing protein [Flavicella marina]|uniref:rhodanese-like domain-containing protein n=1 Tax=Flavicella marina TaxID=1475951 RepID=UPI001264E069|nr:rhodanese-like domain-containing protein [Flavicella marina]
MGLLDFLGIGKKRKKMIQEVLEKGAVIIDVRSEGEFQQGHVAGSINMPLPTITGQINKINKMNKPVVLCCASGMRSGSATSILKGAGIECYNGGSWVNLN